MNAELCNMNTSEAKNFSPWRNLFWQIPPAIKQEASWDKSLDDGTGRDVTDRNPIVSNEVIWSDGSDRLSTWSIDPDIEKLKFWHGKDFEPANMLALASRYPSRSLGYYQILLQNIGYKHRPELEVIQVSQIIRKDGSVEYCLGFWYEL